MIFFRFNSKEFRTAAPFHRLHPSQRSVSETALNNPKRTTTGGLSNEYSGSMSALPDHRRDAEFGSRYSLPADSHVYGASGSLERGDQRKTQTTRTGIHNSSPLQERSTKHGSVPNVNSKSKTVKPNVVDSLSSGTSDSDEE